MIVSFTRSMVHKSHRMSIFGVVDKKIYIFNI